MLEMKGTTFQYIVMTVTVLTICDVKQALRRLAVLLRYTVKKLQQTVLSFDRFYKKRLHNLNLILF